MTWIYVKLDIKPSYVKLKQMATLNTSPTGKAAKGKTRRTTPRVDLTAMVDLMFLLTTFFMLTTSLSELRAANVSKSIPDETPASYPASRTMTILIGKDNKAAYYMGETTKTNMKVVNLNLIENSIAESKAMVKKKYGDDKRKYLIVIIKPTKTAKFKNFVDLIDEMKISRIKSYAIEDQNISEQEKVFMEKQGI